MRIRSTVMLVNYLLLLLMRLKQYVNQEVHYYEHDVDN